MPAARLVRALSTRIADERVLAAIAAVPRECFVAPEYRDAAYDDVALPIAGGQTISQPTVVARMCEVLALRPGDRVLDVGTGSGYAAAVLAQLAAHVWSIERDAGLSAGAADALAAARVPNVTLRVGDGAHGWPEEAPFDGVNVAAAARRAPPAALEDQLAPGGRLVAPVRAHGERLVLVRRDADGRLARRALEPVRFVPLV